MDADDHKSVDSRLVFGATDDVEFGGGAGGCGRGGRFGKDPPFPVGEESGGNMEDEEFANFATPAKYQNCFCDFVFFFWLGWMDGF